MKQGDTVQCDSCGHEAVVQNPVIELFGAQIGYGPGGPKDQLMERDSTVTCYDCFVDDKFTDEEVEQYDL